MIRTLPDDDPERHGWYWRDGAWRYEGTMMEGMAGQGLSPDETATVFRTLAEKNDALQEAHVLLRLARDYIATRPTFNALRLCDRIDGLLADKIPA